jgi:predicted nucleic acid-binding protein
MRLVLDTNVLVSALLGTGSPPAQLLTLWSRRRYQLLTAELQLEELHPRYAVSADPQAATAGPGRRAGQFAL